MASNFGFAVPPIPCAESAVIAAQEFVGEDVVISADTEWDQKFVSGNIIVESGVTLTLFGVLSMGSNSKILVEKNADLILDGGIITSCADNWRGIVVEGDGGSGNQDLAGRVKLMNEAVIENANKAISMKPSHLGWPEMSFHYGGLVEAENSTFRNNKRVLEFMKYGTGFIEDNSYFTNCSFENIDQWAITIWANNNVTFKQCTFDLIGISSIYAVDSEVIVNDNCLFKNQNIGIEIITTFPTFFAPIIGGSENGNLPNDFECNNYGIILEVENNPNLTASYKEYLIAIYEKCIRFLHNLPFIIILEDPNGGPFDQKIEAAIEYGLSLPSFEQKILTYGLLIDDSQLQRARNLLNELMPENEEHANFIRAQNINIDYLFDTENYLLSEKNSTLLRTIGLGINPLDAYARSIYEVITGERLKLEIGRSQELRIPRKQKVDDLNVIYTVYPNPVSSEEMFILVQGKIEPTEVKVKVMNCMAES